MARSSWSGKIVLPQRSDSHSRTVVPGCKRPRRCLSINPHLTQVILQSKLLGRIIAFDLSRSRLIRLRLAVFSTLYESAQSQAYAS
jgi:hypothetical protein